VKVESVFDRETWEVGAADDPAELVKINILVVMSVGRPQTLVSCPP